MASLTQLEARIRATVGDVRAARFSTTNLVYPIINSAMKELASITRKYNVIDTSFTFTAPGPMDLPSDFIGLNRIRLDDNALWKLDFRQIRQWQAGSSTTPNFYSIKAKKLYLVPSPSANVTLELDYIGTPPELDSGADELDESLGPFRDTYVVAYTCRELSIISQDFEAAQQFAGMLGTNEMKSRDWANTEEMFEDHQIYSAEYATDDSFGRAGWVG